MSFARKMKRLTTSLVTSILFAALLTQAASAGEQQLRELFETKGAKEFVFVKEVRKDEGFAYKKTCRRLKNDNKLEEALLEAAKKDYSAEIDYPLIGVLGRLIIFGEDGRPICALQIVTWDCTIAFRSVSKKGELFPIGERFASIRSEKLARWAYDEIRRTDPESIKKMEEFYERGGESLEALLFKGESARVEKQPDGEPK